MSWSAGGAGASVQQPLPLGPGAAADGTRAQEERLARVALNAITEPGDPRVSRLVAAYGAQVVHDRLLEDRELDGLRSEVAARLAGFSADQVLSAAAQRGFRFVIPGDAAWPPTLDDLAGVESLNRLSGAPLGLWLRGPLDLAGSCARSVAVVGSRSATSYGQSVAGELGAGLCSEGVTVVSGAAFGIDVTAHRAALAVGGTTVAVLACGVDRAYPAAHKELLDLLGERGLVVSELAPGCAPTRVRFLSRNRLIAALTRGTVVVEAAVRSGALNTATWATRLNRTVMGVPGSVHSAPSEGVHELIRSGAAQLVTRAEHVLELVSEAGTALYVPPRAEPTARDRLEPVDQRVLEAVPLHQAAPLHSIARTAGLAAAEVRSSLGRLQRLGWVTDVGDSGAQRGDAWRRVGVAADEPESGNLR